MRSDRSTWLLPSSETTRRKDVCPATVLTDIVGRCCYPSVDVVGWLLAGPSTNQLHSYIPCQITTYHSPRRCRALKQRQAGPIRREEPRSWGAPPRGRLSGLERWRLVRRRSGGPRTVAEKRPAGDPNMETLQPHKVAASEPGAHGEFDMANDGGEPASGTGAGAVTVCLKK